ncbi:hypothetical protein M1247_25000 [Mycobacterium sp. 21AC1]|uniref:hypothetical protein n=1 Tax=[Mycobacterium] appelbergii TaxID=2939269 RepID=UPI002939534E|nr:hypothetical protein [Mycobacterium sp. 21AC1]MDV3128195.1 hypothetical protein [Mycobacterium sp. 21AC1]
MSWQNWLAERADGRLWVNVVASWDYLSAQIAPKRLEINLKWYGPEELDRLSWAVGFGSFERVVEQGISAAKTIDDYYAFFNKCYIAETGEWRQDQEFFTPFNSVSPAEALFSWTEASKKALLQRRILIRAVEETDIRTFEIQVDLDEQHCECELDLSMPNDGETVLPGGFAPLGIRKIPKGPISRS